MTDEERKMLYEIVYHRNNLKTMANISFLVSLASLVFNIALLMFVILI